MLPVPSRGPRFAAGLLASGLLAAGAAELAARRFIAIPYLPPVLEKEPFRRAILDSAPAGIAVPARYTGNRWGMRGGEPPWGWRGAETWIAIGSSTTECGMLDDARAWPQRLAEKLGARGRPAWIGNAGQDGITSRSGVLMMDRVVRALRPDGVLVMLGANDMVLSFYDERRAHGSPWDAAFERRLERADWRGSPLRRSCLYREARAFLRRTRAGPPLRIPAPHRGRVPLPLAASEDPLPPRDSLLPSLPRFRENMLRMQALARELGVRAVFLTHPYRYGTGPAWASREGRDLEIGGRKYHISAATERRLLDVFNAELLSLCAASGLECFDLASGMDSEVGEGRDSPYFYDEGHFNDAGAERAASLLEGYLGR